MSKTVKNTRKSKKTRKVLQTHKNISHTNPQKSRIIQMFLGMLNTVKLYHWKTFSYAQHKATDELYAKLNEHIDTFVEIMLGKDENRFSLLNKKIDIIDYSSKNDLKARVYAFRGFLTNMSKSMDPVQDSDLLNVRDEILGDINQFLYLMTFTK
jgi:hypothetical protein